MYFFNLKALLLDLKHNNVTERESALYVLIPIILMMLYSYYLPQTNSLESLANNVIIIINFIILFIVNGGNNGKNFLIKYFSLSWVVAWRVLIFYLVPFTFVFFGLMYFVFPDSLKHDTYGLLVFGIAFEVIYLFFMIKAFRATLQKVVIAYD
ncbi:hypothetical protein [Photobacterium angustum]|uniref:hypothetical protein n=1 Tax=Photobacterium angustum TaxID=661 RepID=UPI0005E73141|nr:hypothetical protein [Photobacterium angustum]KJG22434.1 membrane protein [Photobacterium angustum]KJG28841.1 membrane protein [Photobacterium angustum]PSW96222.1 hypothetical protein C0W79_09290 [Photobacterium angustum]PSX02147.1 hypothetical protein C0W87_10935 [Photobacterium angustum]PSX32920.1 hypothetical protein C0W38_17835 [Photobacterium angustum]